MLLFQIHSGLPSSQIRAMQFPENQAHDKAHEGKPCQGHFRVAWYIDVG